MKNKKAVIGKIITAFLSLCLIVGSILKFFDNDIGSALLTIYKTYMIIIISAVYLIVLFLIFFCGRNNFIDRPEFRKSDIAIAKVINSQKISDKSVSLTVEFMDKKNIIRQSEIATHNSMAFSIFNKRKTVKIRYKTDNDKLKAIIASEYINIKKIFLSVVISVIPMMLILITAII